MSEIVTITVAGQSFGIPVEQVRDVLVPPRLARIPLAPAAVDGVLNLRGNIVVAIDMRKRLGIEAAPASAPRMCVVVAHRDELYSLLVDGVGEVLQVDDAAFDPNPSTLAPTWRQVSRGIVRLEGSLLVVLDIALTLDLAARTQAA